QFSQPSVGSGGSSILGDEFENAIACSMDALDNIDANNSSSSGTPIQYNQDHVSCEDLLDFNHQHNNTTTRVGGGGLKTAATKFGS
ncbi:Tyrosineprotein kinase PR2like, partial [Caligus rogercresseyi]